MRRVVLMIMDGLRRDFVTPAWTPNLCRFGERAAGFPQHRSVFVSTTRVAAASIATGCHPARHELHGNEMALIEDGRLVAHDAGDPDFLQHKRRVTGRSLAVPTLAERVKPLGGGVVFSNVSPGAAYALDPDGHGHVFHRAGSFGPGRVPVAPERHLEVTADGAGDTATTTRFIAETLTADGPPLAVLWLADPDKTQHASTLGSPRHVAALAGADANAGRVIAAVDRLRRDGEDVLLALGSDHGHHTIDGVIDIEAEMVAAGLKRDAESGDVISVSNGTSALIYLHPDHGNRAGRLHDFLASRAWAAQVVASDALPAHGQAAYHGLAFAVSMRSSDAPNRHGVRGLSLEAKPSPGKHDHLDCGQHGGLASWDQSPFLMVEGHGFAAGPRDGQSSIVDIAPTALRHLGLPEVGMEGKTLQAS